MHKAYFWDKLHYKRKHSSLLTGTKKKKKNMNERYGRILQCLSMLGPVLLSETLLSPDHGHQVLNQINVPARINQLLWWDILRGTNRSFTCYISHFER